MKVKIFDTCFSNPSDPTVNVYFELTKELTRLQKEEKAVIKAVKLIFTYPDGEDPYEITDRIFIDNLKAVGFGENNDN